MPVRGVVAATLALVVALLAACSSTPDEDSPVVAYKNAESTRPLEVPPDLAQPETSEALTVPDAQGNVRRQVLPEFEQVRFVRSGVNTWLEIDDLAPEALWPRVEGFVRSQGLDIARSEPALGIVETEWAERFDEPSSGGITGFIGNLLGSIGSDTVRDKYTVRLERLNGSGGTRVFLNHQAATEVNTNPNERDAGDYEWARLGGDSAIEAEMTRRLLVHLGVSTGRAGEIVGDAVDALGVTPRYTVRGGAASIMIDDRNYRRVFARVGDAIGKVGAEVRAAAPERRFYLIEWVPPEEVADTGGFLGLFGGGEPEPVELQVQLEIDSNTVRIKAADAQGTVRSAPVHRALLRKLAVAMGADPAAIQEAEEGGERAEPVAPRRREQDGEPEPGTRPQ